jgi:signal transduction histidine kinase/HAMP domain-containing protein
MATINFPSLRLRLVQLVLLAVLPALALILYGAREEHRSAGEAAERQSLRVARTASDSYERLFDGTRQLLVTLTRLAAVRLGDPRACPVLLTAMLEEYPLYSNLGVADPNGDIFCSGLPLHKPVNIADRSYFQRAVQYLDFSVGEYQIGRRTGKATINFAYPVVDDHGTVRSVVYAALDLAWLKRLAAASQFPANTILTVADERGTILSGIPEPGPWVGKTIPEAEIVRIALADTEGTAVAVGLDGIRRFWGFTTVNMAPRQGRIYVIVGIPTDIALTDARRDLARNLAGLIAVALLSLAVAWRGGDRYILRPVNALLDATAKLSGGDLSARSGTARGTNEIGRLALAFDKMAETLEAHALEVRRTQERLQQSLDRMQALHDIDMAISSKLDLNAMLHVLLEKIDLVLPGGVATVRLIDTEGDSLEPMACRNIDEETWRTNYRGVLHGFAKTVLESKTPITVANLQTDARASWRGFAKRFGLVSYLGVPLIVKDEALGLMAFYTKEEHAFTDEEIEYLATLAGQVAIAIHNARLYEEMRRGKNELSALHALTVAATQSLDLTTVLDEAIKKITDIFHFDVSRVFLFNADMTELEVRASFETKPEFWQQSRRFRRNESVVGRVAETGENIIFEDINRDPRYRELSTSKSSRNAGTRFLAMFPIRTKLKTWGVLVCGAAAPQTLKAGEIELLSAMTSQVGIAVENATLYEQTATKAKELSALYAIAGVASESLDIHLILRRTVERVLQIFGFEAARIYLCQGQERDLNLVFHEGFRADLPLAARYKVGEGLVGKTFASGEPRIIEDMQSDSSYHELARNKLMFQAGFRASFLIPLKVRGETLGVMNFFSRRPHQFSESDLQLIKAIAYHVGVAVGNAHLFSQVRQKTVELEKVNRGKDEFLGVISHELRTPLNVIKGYTEIMLNEVLGGLNEDQNKALQTISNQSMELFSMINGVLQVTRIEAGAVRAAAWEVKLGDLLDELRSNYNFPFGKDITLAWDYRADLPVLETDDEKLKAILQNLINNAIKFTEKGRVTISVRHLSAANGIEIQIADTGIGIPDEKIHSIFDMFEQVDSSATRKFSGVGLGLYIVKKFTELLGGTVQVTSEVGKGSVFTVSLPLSRSRHERVIEQPQSFAGNPSFH